LLPVPGAWGDIGLWRASHTLKPAKAYPSLIRASPSRASALFGPSSLGEVSLSPPRLVSALRPFGLHEGPRKAALHACLSRRPPSPGRIPLLGCAPGQAGGGARAHYRRSLRSTRRLLYPMSLYDRHLSRCFSSFREGGLFVPSPNALFSRF